MQTTIKVEDLDGVELDFWCARACGQKAVIVKPGGKLNRVTVEHGVCAALTPGYDDWWQPVSAQTWFFMGILIERVGIQISPPQSPVHRYGGNSPGWGESGMWAATIFRKGAHKRKVFHDANSPLLVAARAFVAWTFGEEVVPVSEKDYRESV